MSNSPASTIPPASITGRIGKLLVGLLQIYGVVTIVRYFPELRHGTWNTGLWVFVGLAFYLVSFNVRLGLHRVLPVGNAPAVAALVVAGLLAGVEWLRSGGFWGPTLATYALVLTLAVHLHMGISHVLAAVVGMPGCEMRVIPHLLARARGARRGELSLCPGLWTPIDRWEARVRGVEAPG